jgi:hypothetical protein
LRNSTGSGSGRELTKLLVGTSDLLPLLHLDIRGKAGLGEGGRDLVGIPSSLVTKEMRRIHHREIRLCVGVHLRDDIHRASGSTSHAVLSLKVCSPLLTTLGEADIQRLAPKLLVVHLIASLVSFLRGSITNETKSSRYALFILHHNTRGDVAELLEFLNQLNVGNIIVKVLDIQVGASAMGIHGIRAVGLLELLASFILLLSTSNVKRIVPEFRVIQAFYGSLGLLVGLKVEEAKSSRFTGVALHDDAAGDFTILGEESVDIGIRGALRQILHIDVGEILRVLSLTFTLGNERTNEHNKI